MKRRFERYQPTINAEERAHLEAQLRLWHGRILGAEAQVILFRDYRDEVMWEMARAGYSGRHIAQLIGLSNTSVSNVLRRGREQGS